VVLLDDGEHEEPTKKNMLAAYKKIVADSEPGDSIFLHYSGHGSKVKDDDWGEEEDGYDEVLVPLDYQEAGMIRDDDLYDIIVEGVSDGVHVVSLVSETKEKKSRKIWCIILLNAGMSHSNNVPCFLFYSILSVSLFL
jgi:hypothetical protein